jgi:hypothetical protein
MGQTQLVAALATAAGVILILAGARTDMPAPEVAA